MGIIKAKASSYNDVNESAILDYMRKYTIQINDAILNDTLKGKDRTQQKAIVAELETIAKRINKLTRGY